MHRPKTKFDAKCWSVEEKGTLGNQGGIKLFLSQKIFALSYFLVGLRINYKKKSVLKVFLYYFQFTGNFHTILKAVIHFHWHNSISVWVTMSDEESSHHICEYFFADFLDLKNRDCPNRRFPLSLRLNLTARFFSPGLWHRWYVLVAKFHGWLDQRLRKGNFQISKVFHGNFAAATNLWLYTRQVRYSSHTVVQRELWAVRFCCCSPQVQQALSAQSHWWVSWNLGDPPQAPSCTWMRLSWWSALFCIVIFDLLRHLSSTFVTVSSSWCTTVNVISVFEFFLAPFPRIFCEIDYNYTFVHLAIRTKTEEISRILILNIDSPVKIYGE